MEKCLLYDKITFFIFLIFIPSILISFYLSPEYVKNMLILDPSNPSLLSIFFSNFVHSSVFHLGNNLAWYMVVMFILLSIEVNRSMFYKVSLLSLTVLPFLSSLTVILLLPNLSQVQGFSAISSAFLGYLPYSIYAHVKSVYCQELKHSFLILLLLISCTVWSIPNKIYFLTFPLLLLILFLLIYLRKTVKRIATQLRLKLNHLKSGIAKFYYIFILIFSMIFVALGLYIILPSKVMVGNTLINVLSHYIGYLFGIGVPVAIEFMDNKKCVRGVKNDFLLYR